MPDTITAYVEFQSGTKAKSQEVNANLRNHRGTLIPIDPTLAAAAVSGNYALGTSEHPWKEAHVESGFFVPGDVKIHHSYNALLGPGHGWMLCDGRQITEANYNTEHGADTWATYIGTSPLLNKYLPNMTNRYPVGKAATTQDGGSAITAVGNTSHTVSHSHSIPSHNHVWLYAVNTGTTADVTHDIDGNAMSLPTGGTAAGYGIATLSTTAWVGERRIGGPANLYTDNRAVTSTITSISVQPESTEFQYYMRII